ncbi:hypothetical protein DFH07DRAFT_857504 [Mycena maculata]|uniref:Uncharacterized protein n=1 Tax=Mycena maculata TaxID=230809 RepID=A0AAD7HJX1_9AGAR|nr:hypothetical protein DFH07DRAFT_857504 [Mycena maculata]
MNKRIRVGLFSCTLFAKFMAAKAYSCGMKGISDLYEFKSSNCCLRNLGIVLEPEEASVGLGLGDYCDLGQALEKSFTSHPDLIKPRQNWHSQIRTGFIISMLRFGKLVSEVHRATDFMT